MRTLNKPSFGPICPEFYSPDYLLNALFGLWWADPVVGLAMVPIIAKEGIEGLQDKASDDCCSP
jgi:hypothetical protein